MACLLYTSDLNVGYSLILPDKLLHSLFSMRNNRRITASLFFQLLFLAMCHVLALSLIHIFSHMVLDDLNLIIRDIREAHKKDSESAPQTTVADLSLIHI